MFLDDRLTIFVYGTLMKGFGNERVIAEFSHMNYSARVNNMELYDVGYYPAMVRGKHSYLGELVVFDKSVDSEKLYMHMDMLEGYRENNKENSLYLREPVEVSIDGKTVKTEVYLWNRDVSTLKYIDPRVYSGYADYLSSRR